MSSAARADLPPSSIPIFTTVAAYKEWRTKAFEAHKSVGFVATMGALHDGHASLVKHSLAQNDLTVVSIFVNPAQFAPHEDLATYPRTLAHDLAVLSSLRSPGTQRTPAAVFAPTVPEMYPSGAAQDPTQRRGAFVEVKGFSHQMEGASRPTFFTGVATVVTKLFNVIQPTRTYFGQKDIQQALLLRRMTRDLLLPHPTPENLHIVPIARDPTTHLALSSRNAYLSPTARTRAAPALYAALTTARTAWDAGSTKAECIQRAIDVVDQRARELAESSESKDAGTGAQEEVALRLDYVEMNDPETFDVLPDDATRAAWESAEKADGSETDGKRRPVILSGAMWVGKTRLIDNIIVGDAARLGVLPA